MKIEGIINFKEGIRLKKTCLNRSYDIIVGSVKGKLKTPKLPLNFNKVSSDEWNSQLLEEPPSDIKYRYNIEWGRTVSFPSGDSIVKYVKIEFKIPEAKKVNETGEKINSDLPDWITRFKENLAALGHNPKLPSTIVEQGEYINFELAYKENDKLDRISPKGLSGNITVILREAISLSVFKKCISITNEGKSPITEYSLLRDAQYALSEKNYRKSILDSATALEVCLANQLIRKLKIKEKIHKEILSNYNSISKKRKLLKTLGTKLLNHNYKNKVEDLRNRVIHAGITPSEKETRNAYKIVRETVDYLTKNKFN